MDSSALMTMVRFNNWANLHLLDIAAHVDEAALREESSFCDLGTPFQTLRHLLEVEWGWMRVARNRELPAELWHAAPPPDLDAMRAAAQRLAPELEAYAAGLSDEALAEKVDVAPSGFPPEWARRIDLLMHLLNHSTIHRTELAHFLTSRGHSPGNFDYIDFVLQVEH